MKSLSSYVLAVGLTACATGGHVSGNKVKDVSREEVEVIDPSKVGEVECAFQDVVNVSEGIREKCCLIFPRKKACWEGSLAEMGRAKVKVVGKERIVGFELVKAQVSAQEYKEYVVSKLASALDVGVFVEQMVSYKKMGDGLFSANEVLERGGGDCDNLSNLFKELLMAVGEKMGIDYRAKVVGMSDAGHAIAVFLDRNKEWKGFDQNMPFRSIGNDDGTVDLVRGSAEFLDFQKSETENDIIFFERIKLSGNQYGKGAYYDLYLKEGGFETMKDKMIVNTGVLFDKNIDLLNYCPGSQGVSVESVQIDFRDVTAFLQNGKMDQLQYKVGEVSVEFYDGVLGLLMESHYRNGDVEKYKQGKLSYRTFVSGSVETEFYYFGTGKVEQRNFRDKHIEWYDENGKVIQIRDKDGNVERFDG